MSQFTRISLTLFRIRESDALSVRLATLAVVTIWEPGNRMNVRRRSNPRGAGHSLRCGLDAPPTATQASASGVAGETQSML